MVNTFKNIPKMYLKMPLFHSTLKKYLKIFKCFPNIQLMASLGGCLTTTMSINCFDLLIDVRVVVIVCCGVGCEQESPLG